MRKWLIVGLVTAAVLLGHAHKASAAWFPGSRARATRNALRRTLARTYASLDWRRERFERMALEGREPIYWMQYGERRERIRCERQRQLGADFGTYEAILGDLRSLGRELEQGR